VLRGLKGRIDLLLDAGPTSGGLESTVLDVTSTSPRLLRPGLVSRAQIESVIGTIQRSLPLAVSPDQPLPSPGMSSRHYAPRAPLEMIEGDATARVKELGRQGVLVGWLTLTGVAEMPDARAAIIAMPKTLAEYGSQLYAALHELDQQGVERIIVSMPPDTEEWSAVRDRLRRASR
jgi:L-threonylcarbamoyladenylate synthase